MCAGRDRVADTSPQSSAWTRRDLVVLLGVDQEHIPDLALAADVRGMLKDCLGEAVGFDASIDSLRVQV
jgi:hypothetical protein